MYSYHPRINALSAHMIHINLNMIFYSSVEHSPTKTIYVKYYMEEEKNTHHTHTDCTVSYTMSYTHMYHTHHKKCIILLYHTRAFFFF